jgi:hypothetical protein
MADSMDDLVYFPPRRPVYFDSLNVVIGSTPSSLIPHAEAFKRNVQSVVSLASLPIWFAASTAHSMRYQELRIRAQLRHGDRSIPDRDIANREQEDSVHALLDELNAQNPQDIAEDVLDYLSTVVVQDQSMVRTAKELTRQATVLLWGALEVLANDLFSTLLNHLPGLALEFNSDAQARKFFALKELSLCLNSLQSTATTSPIEWATSSQDKYP